eukprot:TRINITY_DN38642_c0_g1_i1.p1 TRINITY_DN38642_c0_g1~~TRINITY_DN38642_c0_g1_i1.p1  ORF type:complete len:538 (-),score=79.70 TRINITY_DN38642_c0_g1_i1:529-2079(-)
MAAMASPWVVAILVAVFAPIISHAVVSSSSSCITSYSADTNYFSAEYNSSDPFALPLTETVVDTALVFAVQYHNYYKVVHDNYTSTSYVLYQCGAPVPANLTSTVKPIQIPVTSVALTGTVPVAYFELLGLTSLIKVGADAGFLQAVTSPCIQKLVAAGTIEAINVTAFELGQSKFTGVMFSDSQMASSSYSVNYVNFDASEDPGPLRRAEWIRYLALFFNLEVHALAVYDTIAANYQCQNGSNTFTAADAPVVAWINFAYYGNLTAALEDYKTQGNWTVSLADYKTQLVADAGGMNLDTSIGGNVFTTSAARTVSFSPSIDMEYRSFKALLKTIDIVIDETFAYDPPAYNMSTFLTLFNISDADSETFPFVANKRVWRFDRRIAAVPGDYGYGYDWYEGSLAQPQIILNEMLGMLNASRNHSHYFFRNIAEGESAVLVSADSCTGDATAALQPTIFTCPVTTATTSGGSSTPSPSPASTPTGGAAALGGSSATLFGMSGAALLLSVFALVLVPFV